MIRLLMALLGKSYEPCKSCETLKYELDRVNHEKEVLLNTMLGLIKPEIVPRSEIPVEPIKSRIINWNREKARLEEQSRAEARIKKEMEREKAIIEAEKEVLDVDVKESNANEKE